MSVILVFAASLCLDKVLSVILILLIATCSLLPKGRAIIDKKAVHFISKNLLLFAVSENT
jgi:hypothetical protein